MKKAYFLFVFILNVGFLYGLKVPQSVCVDVIGRHSVLIRETLESALNALSNIHAVYIDSFKAKSDDPQRFLAQTGLDGLVVGKILSNGLSLKFYGHKKTESLLISYRKGLDWYNQIAKAFKQKALSFYPTRKQKILIKEKLVKKTVSPLEYYRPVLQVGIYTGIENAVFSLRTTTTNDVDIQNALHFTPGLFLDYNYRHLSLTLEAFALWSSQKTQTVNNADFVIQNGYRVNVLAGVWLYRGLIHLSVGFNWIMIPIRVSESGHEYSLTFDAFRLYPQIGFKFSDAFRFELSAIGFQLDRPSFHKNLGDDPIFQFRLNWDLALNKQLHLRLDMTLYEVTGYEKKAFLGDPEGAIILKENNYGLFLSYYFSMGAKK